MEVVEEQNTPQSGRRRRLLLLQLQVAVGKTVLFTHGPLLLSAGGDVVGVVVVGLLAVHMALLLQLLLKLLHPSPPASTRRRTRPFISPPTLCKLARLWGFGTILVAVYRPYILM